MCTLHIHNLMAVNSISFAHLHVRCTPGCHGVHVWTHTQNQETRHPGYVSSPPHLHDAPHGVLWGVRVDTQTKSRNSSPGVHCMAHDTHTHTRARAHTRTCPSIAVSRGRGPASRTQRTLTPPWVASMRGVNMGNVHLHDRLRQFLQAAIRCLGRVGVGDGFEQAAQNDLVAPALRHGRHSSLDAIPQLVDGATVGHHCNCRWSRVFARLCVCVCVSAEEKGQSDRRMATRLVIPTRRRPRSTPKHAEMN